MSGEGTEDRNFSEAARFQRDLYLYLRVAREEDGLALTARGYVSRPALRRARAALLAVEGRQPLASDGEPPESSDGRLFFIRRLLERLSLLHAGQTPERTVRRLVAAPRDEVAAYFARPLVERLRFCARVWVGGGWWPDTLDARASIPGVMTPAAPRVALARRRLIEWLAALRSGAAIDLPTAPATALPHTRVRRNARPLEADHETARAALEGPLKWLGFVKAEEGKPIGYRAEAACGALASSGDAELSEAHGRVTIQPDLSIIAYPPLSAPLLAALDHYADLGQLDRVARYKLSRAALARSGRSAWEADALAERLERLTGAPLPENIRVILRDWQRQGERIRAVEDAAVLELDDVTLLDVLLADRAAHGWIERRLSATAALIAAGHVADVRAWLLRRGELPATLRGR
jgi:hypothetical protein